MSIDGIADETLIIYLSDPLFELFGVDETVAGVDSNSSLLPIRRGEHNTASLQLLEVGLGKSYEV